MSLKRQYFLSVFTLDFVGALSDLNNKILHFGRVVIFN